MPGPIAVGRGGGGSSGFTNPMTTQDDLIIGGAAGAGARLAKGSDGYVLKVDPTTHHLVWAAIFGPAPAPVPVNTDVVLDTGGTITAGGNILSSLGLAVKGNGTTTPSNIAFQDHTGLEVAKMFVREPGGGYQHLYIQTEDDHTQLVLLSYADLSLTSGLGNVLLQPAGGTIAYGALSGTTPVVQIAGLNSLDTNPALQVLDHLGNIVLEVGGLGAVTGTNIGNSISKNVGTGAGTVAAGDDSRITGAAQKASNLSDLASASTARTNLGLGTLATQSGTFSGTSSGTNTGDQTVPAFATPSVALGTAAAAGSASTVIRSDATIAAFDATSPSTQAFGDSAAAGSAAVAARRDHKHAMPAAPTDASLSTSDITTNDVSTSKHGFAPKGDGTTSKYLNANGAYSAVPAGSTSTPGLVQLATNAQNAASRVVQGNDARLPIWAKIGASQLVACYGNGEPDTLANLVVAATGTPNLMSGSGVRACMVLFQLPYNFNPTDLWFFGRGSLASALCFAIYPYGSGTTKLWQSGDVTVANATWTDVTAGSLSSINLVAGTAYWLACSSTLASNSTAVAEVPSLGGSFAKWGTDSAPLGGGLGVGMPVAATIAITSGAFPGTLPAIAAGVAYPPACWLTGTSS